MIHHISIPACQPLEVAKVLAELFNGVLTEFGPNPGSYIAWTGDEFGTAIEVFPVETELQPDDEHGQANFRRNSNASQYSATHAAISVTRSKDEIVDIAKREGWRAIELSRGSFRVIEFWIENRFMLEVMPPDMAQEYLTMTERFRS